VVKLIDLLLSMWVLTSFITIEFVAISIFLTWQCHYEEEVLSYEKGEFHPNDT
jgi:hypothetical protein